VKQSQQLRDAADVAVREAESALHALRAVMRQSPNRTAALDDRQLTGRPVCGVGGAEADRRHKLI